MTCLRCEIARARLIGAYWLIVGNSLDEVAGRLTKRFGVPYVVRGKQIWRETPPFSNFILNE